MKNKPIYCLGFLIVLSVPAFSNLLLDSIPLPPQSRLLRFTESNGADSAWAVLHLFLREQDTGEPVLGATSLMLRQNPDVVYGKVTQWDGRCVFKASPGVYNLRIQLTGMAAFEYQKISLLAGRQYQMEIEMARMKPPVPSAKQQAGRNRR